MKTYYAPPEREDKDNVEKQSASVSGYKNLIELVASLPNIITILNSKRQIVYSNDILVNALKVEDFKELLGRRPGEVIRCIHADENEGGCGTSEACRYCGAVNTILKSQKENRTIVGECRITATNGQHIESYDYEVTAAPFNWDNEQFIMFSLVDISHRKRRKMLERIFYHDVLNTAGNIRGLADLAYKSDEPDRREELLRLIIRSGDELLEEIHSQRQLTQAEEGDLIPKFESLNSIEILDCVTAPFMSGLKNGIKLFIDEESDEVSLHSDRGILLRILRNMVKNALEASRQNDMVTIGSIKENDSVRFWVHNTQVMPAEVRNQVFQRSYSTKAIDRGWGTYSMKLLGEKYLGGKVSFTSSETDGTIFQFEIPLQL